MKIVSLVALVLVIIGALNWGLWGFFQFDLVAWIFGGNTTGLSRLIYALIGISGLLVLNKFKKCCHMLCGCPCCEGKGAKGCSCKM